MVAVVVAAYTLAVAAASVVGYLAWSNRRLLGVAGPALVTVAVGLVWWAGCEAVIAAGDGGPVLAVAVRALFPGVAVAVNGFVVFARAVADRNWVPSRRTVALLAVHPLVVGLAALVDARARLLVASHRDGRLWVLWEPGPLVWVHVLYCYVLLGGCLVVVLRAAANAGRVHRRQLRVVLLAALAPAVGNLLSLSTMGRDVPDLTPMFFVASVAVDWWVLRQVSLLRVAPIARSDVLERLGDAVIVLDAGNRLVDTNTAGERLVRAIVPDGTRPLDGLPGWHVLGTPGIPGPLADGERRVAVDGVEVVLDIRVEELTDDRGRATGTVVVCRDISRLQVQRDALTAANDQLRAQVDTIDRLRSELAELVVRDDLTGLYNRRHLVRALGAALERTTRRGQDLAVVLLDVDRFKGVNDRYGHDVGDQVLVAFARTLQQGVRRTDTLARYGGEEFVALLPGADATDAVVRVEQWRRACADVVVESTHGPVRTTVSAGVATMSRNGSDPAALLRAADAALYAAKAGGRDRVVVADPTTTG